ncbi:MAG: metallophosphoesterase family protein [Candidatus Limiplasma sp.]|nr:metallophosphoesterase family protein [Clostridiales bacterium]MDY3817389.1 metallophosphoesterase family protein [Candidatus Limiplasma sp.]
MKILLLADKESAYLWDHYEPGRLDGIDLILSCGDLKASYLSFLVTMSSVPLLYVHGNHDCNYAIQPPEGCDCIDDKLVTIGGLRILGLGGSPMYNGNKHQYTEDQMQRRIKKLKWQIQRAGGVDLLLTHAPARGYGDAEDRAHRGFESFVQLLDTYHPRYMVHGHVHMNYGMSIPRRQQRDGTTIINAWDRYLLDTDQP